MNDSKPHLSGILVIVLRACLAYAASSSPISLPVMVIVQLFNGVSSRPFEQLGGMIPALQWSHMALFESLLGFRALLWLLDGIFQSLEDELVLEMFQKGRQ